MRKRPAIRWPGRKRPSLTKDAVELEGRDADPDAGRGDRSGVAGAKSSVATSSLPGTGVPHDEQKRPALGTSVPQAVHVDMNFPDTVYRVRNGM